MMVKYDFPMVTNDITPYKLMIIVILSIYLEHNKSTWYNLGHVNKHKLLHKIA